VSRTFLLGAAGAVAAILLIGTLYLAGVGAFALLDARAADPYRRCIDVAIYMPGTEKIMDELRRCQALRQK
jgi:hypothetical protein